ncbi:MAG: T9SS type A sorting domain-containing protein [Ignavibacteriales bacterium]|nr:T9SS type A sorting domain-containing protein [Ignavibacteriales bacterium]
MKRFASIVIMIAAFSVASSQSFDLMTAKSTDKVAKSRFFAVDSQKVINTYDLTSIGAPVARSADSVFHVEAIRYQLSSASAQSAVAPKVFSLGQNYPNPFNPSTTIRYNVGKKAKVSVVLYDMLGKVVTTLVSDTKETGAYDARWDGTNQNGMQVSSGTYLYRMIASNDDGSVNVETKKMMLVR